MRNDCLICFAPWVNQISLQHYLCRYEDCICEGCRQKMRKIQHLFLWEGVSLDALYYYDTYLEGLFFQYKECRDIALYPIFLQPFMKRLNKQYASYTLVYIASHEKKTKERGFHALEKMSAALTMNKMHLFEKRKEYKQSAQTFEGRKKINEVLFLKKGVTLPNTKILLFDDVCTSGATLKRALTLLKNHKHEIAILVCSVNETIIDLCKVKNKPIRIKK